VSDAEFRSVVEGFAERRTSSIGAPPPVSTVAVLGAGPIGLAIACEALAEGRETRLWSPFASETARESVTIRGAHLVGTYRFGAAQPAPSIALATGIDAAVLGADLIVVAVPALSMSSLATFLAPHLSDGQIVLLVGGRRFGAAEMRRELARNGSTTSIVVAELTAPPYTVSTTANGGLLIHSRHARVGLGVSPASATAEVASRLGWGAVQLDAHDSTMHSSFAETTGLLNVAPVLLNVGAATTAGTTWSQLMSPTVCDAITAVDGERQAVGFAYGVRDLAPVAQQLAQIHGLSDAPMSLHEAWHSIAALDDLQVPIGNLRRLLADDVACSLNPLASAGRVSGIATPATDSLIAMAGLVVGQDLAALGRSVESLGLGGLSVEQIRGRLRGEGW
jgi:opine dehydrogenase